MTMLVRLLTGLVCACALFVSPLRAEERISDYHVDIDVAPDGVLHITERILIKAENDNIVHGINREIPLAFIAADGRRARSFLSAVDVERDGEAEHYRLIETNRGVVIRIGSSDVELIPDDYLYEIRYRVNRVVSFWEGHDRLVWNVNGTEGMFPIDALSVRVTLPDEATLNEWRQADDASTTSATVTILFSALLAFVLWFLFGRDPRAGVIVPRWDAPGGLSPGRVNYSASRNFESGFWTAFSASIIDLAVKGKLVLEDLSDGITVRKRSDQDDSALPQEQAVIMRMLPVAGEPFRFGSENAARTLELGEAF